MSVVVFSFASCGDDKDSKDADSKKSKDVNGGSGDTWGACACIKYQGEMTAKMETASEEDLEKLIEEGNATINSKCAAYKEMGEKQVYEACEEESKCKPLGFTHACKLILITSCLFSHHTFKIRHFKLCLFRLNRCKITNGLTRHYWIRLSR